MYKERLLHKNRGSLYVYKKRGDYVYIDVTSYMYNI